MVDWDGELLSALMGRGGGTFWEWELFVFIAAREKVPKTLG